MSKSKKGTQKKAAKAATTNGDKLSAKVLQEAMRDLEAGTAGIRELGISLGFSSGAPLRKALKESVGDAVYAKVIAAGREARGIPEGFGAKKAAKKGAATKATKKGRMTKRSKKEAVIAIPEEVATATKAAPKKGKRAKASS